MKIKGDGAGGYPVHTVPIRWQSAALPSDPGSFAGRLGFLEAVGGDEVVVGAFGRGVGALSLNLSDFSGMIPSTLVSLLPWW